ncbi:MAG: hypothetical protein PHQ64_00650 [Bacilli bacterium]|nr:hypothetical protein [Bacilli bacterium]
MDINYVIRKYKPFVEKLSDHYDYPDNIRHVLLLIIPLFIYKYKLENEKIILSTFLETPIIINNKDLGPLKASYVFDLDKGEEIKLKKKIVINNYKNINILELIDCIVHEYMHAINSKINYYKKEDKIISIRTGLSYVFYDSNYNLIGKNKKYILEEIINTKETELFVNMINELNFDDSLDEEIYNLVATLKRLIMNGYKTKAYILQMHICRIIVNNRSFYNTILNFRFKGELEEIDRWFDFFTGISGSYNQLNDELVNIFELSKLYDNKKMFKKKIVRKIRIGNEKIQKIIDKFDKGSLYK